MTNSIAAIIEEYYDALTAGAVAYDGGRRMRPLLAEDLLFEGPIAGHVEGADLFVEGVAGFIGTVQRIDLLHRTYDGDVAASMYDAVLPDGVTRFAEFHRVTDGRIGSLRLVYDAETYIASGGR